MDTNNGVRILFEGMGSAGWRRAREETWDNCNSIINEIKLKKKISELITYFPFKKGKQGYEK